VLTVGNEKSEITGCQLEVKPESQKARLVLYLKQEYNCQSIPPLSDGGADLIVRVGKSFGERWQVSDNVLFQE